MKLYIYVADHDLLDMYRNSVNSRRQTDSGFDLFTPAYTVTPKTYGFTLNLSVKVAATDEQGNPIPCLLVPRSSISGTPLRLSNSIGLIDMGYRGDVIAKVDSRYENEFPVFFGARYFQLVAPNWMPWTEVIVVSDVSQLPPAPDNRGSGGFGSTGR
jgi:dUTP pyrophosphatase